MTVVPTDGQIIQRQCDDDDDVENARWACSLCDAEAFRLNSRTENLDMFALAVP